MFALAADVFQVINEKYAETLTAVANALSKQVIDTALYLLIPYYVPRVTILQLPSTFTVIPISVVAGTGRRLLQAGQFTAKLGVTSTLLSGTVNPATTISSINATTLAGSLQTELQVCIRLLSLADDHYDGIMIVLVVEKRVAHVK